MSDLDTLEAQVAADRENLGRSLDQLAHTLSPESLAGEVNAAVSGYGGDIGRMAFETAKRNPAAVGLLGAGLALMLIGPGTRPTRKPNTRAVKPEQAMRGFDERLAAADAAIRQDMAEEASRPSSSRLRATMNKGLDALPASARDRVLKARRAAIAAQEEVEAKAREIASRAKGFHAERPLATGALALAFGAVIGALLPGTRKENRLLGEKRDALMRKAQEALKEEIEMVSRSASDNVAAFRATER